MELELEMTEMSVIHYHVTESIVIFALKVNNELITHTKFNKLLFCKNLII